MKFNLSTELIYSQSSSIALLFIHKDIEVAQKQHQYNFLKGKRI